MVNVSSDWLGTEEETLGAFLLVGAFMGHWAAVEAELNRTLSELLDVGLIESDILCANMQVRDKIHAVRTLMTLYCKTDAALAKHLGKTLDRVVSLNKRRNVCAHNMFAGTPEGGVSFFTVKAKGVWSNPDEVWTADEFEGLFGECKTASDDLQDLAEIVKDRRDRVKALRKRANSAPRDPSDRPTTQVQEDQGSPEPTLAPRPQGAPEDE